MGCFCFSHKKFSLTGIQLISFTKVNILATLTLAVLKINKINKYQNTMNSIFF